MIETIKKSNYINSFLGLRFIVVTCLFFHHLDMFNSLNIPEWVDKWMPWFNEGYFSVNFFFILSGFVVSYGYTERLKNHDVTQKKFILNRFAHLCPTHILALAVCLIVYKSGKTIISHLTNPVLWLNALMLHAWIPDMSGSIAFSYNGLAWTVSAEWFCYFAFLLILRLSRKERWLLTGTAWAFIICNAWLGAQGIISIQTWIYYINPLFRMADFMLGMALFDLYKQGIFKPKSKTVASLSEIMAIVILVAFIVIAVKMPSINWTWRWQIFYTLPSALLVYVFSFNLGILSRILSSSIFRQLGKLALPIYLFHQIVLALCKQYALPYLDSNIAIVATSIVAFMITLILAWIIERVYTTPIDRLLRNKLLKLQTNSKNV